MTRIISVDSRIALVFYDTLTDWRKRISFQCIHQLIFEFSRIWFSKHKTLQNRSLKFSLFWFLYGNLMFLLWTPIFPHFYLGIFQDNRNFFNNKSTWRRVTGSTEEQKIAEKGSHQFSFIKNYHWNCLPSVMNQTDVERRLKCVFWEICSCPNSRRNSIGRSHRQLQCDENSCWDFLRSLLTTLNRCSLVIL